MSRRAAPLARLSSLLLASAALGGCGLEQDPRSDRAQAVAAELGLVMATSGARGTDGRRLSRFAVGPGGDEVQVIRARGVVYDGGAEVILRLRLAGIDRYGQPTVDRPRCFAYRFEGGWDAGHARTLPGRLLPKDLGRLVGAPGRRGGRLSLRRRPPACRSGGAASAMPAPSTAKAIAAR